MGLISRSTVPVWLKPSSASRRLAAQDAVEATPAQASCSPRRLRFKDRSPAHSPWPHPLAHLAHLAPPAVNVTFFLTHASPFLVMPRSTSLCLDTVTASTAAQRQQQFPNRVVFSTFTFGTLLYGDAV